jgi:uncharacterized membrane protein
MTRRAVTAVFKTQNEAYEAASDIEKLDKDKDEVRVRQGSLVTKDLKGNVSVLDTKGNDVPWGTIGGPIVGGLIGLIGGPATAAVGAGAGLLTGWTGDLVHLGMDEDMVRSVSAEVNPGDSALIAEIDEGSTRPIDEIVARHHGRIYRTDVWA